MGRQVLPGWMRGSVLALLVAGALQAAVPELAYVTAGSQDDSPVLVFGEGLDNTQVQFFSVCPDTAKDLGEALKAARPGDSEPAPEPTGAAGPLRVLSRTAQVACVVLPRWPQRWGTLTPQYLYARSPEGWSSPYAINRPEVYFLEASEVSPGQTVRVFGRNLFPRNDNKLTRMFLRDAKSRKVYPLRWGWPYDRQNHMNYQLQFEVSFEVPADLAEGSYEVWLHTGLGGPLGWSSKPLQLGVRKARAGAGKVFRLAEYGAVGDGVADDTGALEKAVEAARQAGGGAVLVPTGRFALTRPLLLPSGVELRGMGRNRSTIEVPEDQPFQREFREGQWLGYARDFLPYVKAHRTTTMLWLNSNTAVRDLELIARQGVAQNLYSLVEEGPGYSRGDFHDVVVDNCRLIVVGSNLMTPSDTFVPDFSCFGGGNLWRRVRLTNNEMRAEHGCGSYAGMVECTIAHNNYEPEGKSWGTTGFTVMGGWHNLIEDNVIRYSNRGFTANLWAMKNQGENFIARNQVVEGGPNQGAAESYLIEGEGGRERWFGRVAQAGPDWVEGAYGGPPEKALPEEAYAGNPAGTDPPNFEADALQDVYVVVLKGRGLGQYRVIKSNTARRIVVTEPWRVAPDATSWIMVLRMWHHNVLLNNISRSTLGSLEIWGGALENVVYRHMTWDTAPLHLWGRTSPTMYNRVQACQVYNGALGLWNLGGYDTSTRLPVLLGNVVSENQIERGSLLLVRRSYGSKGYLPLEDPLVVRGGPAIVSNLFTGNNVQPWPDQPAVHVSDAGCAGNVFYANSYPAERVLDKGAGTVFEGNRDQLRYHFKDAFNYDIRAYEQGRTY